MFLNRHINGHITSDCQSRGGFSYGEHKRHPLLTIRIMEALLGNIKGYHMTTNEERAPISGSIKVQLIADQQHKTRGT